MARVWAAGSCATLAIVVLSPASRKPQEGSDRKTNPPALPKLRTKKLLMVENGGKRLGLTYSRVEGEGHEKPTAISKTWGTCHIIMSISFLSPQKVGYDTKCLKGRSSSKRDVDQMLG